MEFGLIKHKIKKHRLIFLIVFFSIYMFEYMVTLTFIDQRNIGVSNSAWQLALHYMDYVLAAMGFLAFALLRKIFPHEKARIRLLVIPNLVYFISVISLYFIKAPIAYSLMAMLAAFSLGALGGMVYFCMSLALSQTPYIGKVMAIGASIAIVLQYLLQEYLDIMLGIPVMLVLGFSATLWLAVKKPWEWLGEDCLPYDKESVESKKDIRNSLLILSLTVIALSVIGTFYDTQMMRLNIQTNYQQFNYYSWPRLFVIAGYVLIGFIGDIKKQKYVPLATLCMAMFAVFNPILFAELEDYHFNMCLYYICLGANIAYFNLMFWNIAQKTDHPELWAGMGRVISGLAEAILAAACIADLPLNLIIGIDILMFVVLVLSLAAGGYLLLGRKTGGDEKDTGLSEKPELSPQQRLELYAQHCSLTPRETEVLVKLLTTDDDLQRIADSLYISRRMVQRYVSSIYEKTETKTRLGLFQSYMNFTAD
jgi:DNA-binding CsgD family transcriptional regulator